MSPGRREGAVVWVVATDETAGRWARGIEEAGFAPVPLAWSEVVAPEDPSQLDVAFAETVDLVVFTSPNALRFLPGGVGSGRPAACVGRSTAQAAATAGFDVRRVGEAVGTDLAERIVRDLPSVARILFVQGSDAREEPVEVLRRAGRHVVVVVSYVKRPRPAFVAEVREAPTPAAVVVGSPRAGESLADALDVAGRSELLTQVPFVALGETTSTRLFSLGFGSVRTALRPDAAALVEALRLPRSGAGRPGEGPPLQ